MASEGAEYDGTGDSKAVDPKPPDPKAVDPKTPDPKAVDPDPKAVDPKVTAAIAAAEAAGPQSGQTVRVDSWIWAVRLVKTRSLGATACRGGHVRVNGERVKPAHAVRVGDEVRVRHEGRERVVVVTRLIRKRVGAPVAAQCYIDNSPPPPPREAVAPAGIRDRGAGRPTKRDRREMERLRGLAGPGPGPVPGPGSGGAGRRGPGLGAGPGGGSGRPRP
ncbi:RNA-binding S4 domain-containing protein [Streptomyces afghaniensis]|uniref:RNA-binding S4 domain-containing protein n=1 Tax=Streptomyces afghaniensis TaxID=66865 RepID=UPI00278A019F|nr:RNA-binding S4 domain-containing protein [Streptomyces afghaniensis]MDQ1020378.1 ribosome-associated heat shock protein Hsp15 [Streptomyces afghaniensis]